ncbi:MAG: hypothetical protein K8F36_00785 [Melioribacteraceae bacterium]|nr:hypothetical protein [Melioribacteraceae bacterium]
MLNEVLKNHLLKRINSINISEEKKYSMNAEDYDLTKIEEKTIKQINCEFVEKKTARKINVEIKVY